MTMLLLGRAARSVPVFLLTLLTSATLLAQAAIISYSTAQIDPAGLVISPQSHESGNNRTTSLSDDATLASLSISSGMLSPTFASATEGYTASVGYSTTSITVTPTVNEPSAAVQVNGAAVSSGSASGSLPLNLGNNVITVLVTAGDGNSTKTYTIAVTRTAPITVSGSTGLDGNTTFTTLSGSGGLFAALNSNPLDQAGNEILVTITGDITTENGANALNAGLWGSLIISPSGARTISGSSTTGLINLNGADYVSIDGLNADGNSLVINNTSTATFNTVSTIKFYSEAKDNTIVRCTIKGSGQNTATGVIVFSTGSSFGNSYNYIGENVITAGAGNPNNAIYSVGSSVSVSNSSNTIADNAISDYHNATSATNGIYLGANNRMWTISGNQFFQSASRSASANVRAINIVSSNGGAYTITDNIIGFANGNGTGSTTYTSSGTGVGFAAIELTSNGSESTIENNTVANINFNVSGTGASHKGISILGGTVSISRNTLYGLATSASNAVVYGISIDRGTATVFNNRIASLRATTGSLTAPAPSVAGMYVGSNSPTVNAYFNTIYLSGTSTGTNFGSAAVYAHTSATLEMNNNILANACTARGTGKAIAYQRSSASINTYSASSNSNDLAAANLFYNGATAYTTLSSYKAAVSPREANSISETPAFLSTTGGTAHFLKINTSVSTGLESGAEQIISADISDDFEGDPRGSTPDIGADEFDGLSNVMLSGLTISSGTLAPGFSATTEVYTATVSNATTSITVTPTLSNVSSALTVNGITVSSGTASGPIALAVGDNFIDVTVTSAEGSATKTYTIIVTRLSNDATLSALGLSVGTLSPAFASATSSYVACLGQEVASVAVTPTTSSNTASVQVRINGSAYTPVTSGSASTALALNLGANSIDVLVTAQDGIATQSYSITATRMPTPFISGASTLCAGSSVTLTSSSATGNQWSLDASPLSGGSNATYEATNAGIYTVTVTDANGCSATSAPVAISAISPSVGPGTLNGSAAIVCAGTNVVLSQTGGSLGTGAHWQWYTDGGFTQPVPSGNTSAPNAQITVSPISNTTYYLRAENGTAPCAAIVGSAAQSVTVSVHPITVAGTISGAAAICSGNNPGTLTLSGNVGSVVKWQSASDAGFTQNVVDYNNSTTSLSGAAIGDLTSSIYVRAQVNSGGCTMQATAAVLIVVNQPTGSTTFITICSDATPYNWNGQGYSASGSYTVHLSNQNNCDSTATLNLTVSTCTQPAVSYSGSPYCSSTGTATPVITAVPGGTFASQPGLSIDAGSGVIDLAASVPGTYTVSYGAGAVLATAMVSVRPATYIDLVGNAVLCNAATAPALSFSGAAGLSFSWTASNPAIGIATSGVGNQPAFTAVNTGTSPVYSFVYVKASGGTGCGAMRIMTFRYTVNPTPVIGAVANQALCAGRLTNPVSFTSSVAGATISWMNNNNAVGLAASGTGIIPAFNAVNNTGVLQTATVTTSAVAAGCASAPTSFAIAVSPSAGTINYPGSPYCQVGPAVPTRTGSLGGTYTSTAGLDLNSTTGSINLGASTPGTYTVTYTVAASGGCSSTATALITINPQAFVNNLGNQVYCNGMVTTPIPFSGNAPGYNWTNTNTSIGLAASGSGTFLPSFTTVNAGPGVQYANVRVTPQGNGSTTCPGRGFTFRIAVNFCPPVTQAGDHSGDGSTARMQQSFQVGPNPARSTVVLQYNGTEQGPFTVQLISQHGTPMGKAATMSGTTYAMDLSNVTPGSYLLKVTHVKTGISFNKQVIKL